MLPVIPRLELVLVGFAAVLATALFPLVTTPLARFARVELRQVVFGSGPKIFATRVGPTLFELRLLPITSWIKAAGQGVYEEGPIDPPIGPGRVPWREASPVRRVLAFVVAPRLVIFALAVIGVGPARASDALVRGIGQILAGALGPFSTARTILASGAELLAREGAWVVISVALAKWSALGVLTLLSDAAGATDTSEARARTIAKVRAVMLLVVLALFASWLVASVTWALAGGTRAH
jgi:hypothetical protein